jgi:hypothetical protein
MVFFTLTRKGYDELVAALGSAPKLLWATQDVFTPAEIKQLHESGVKISNFTYTVDPTNAGQKSEVIDMIKLHHPGHGLWIETPSTD